MALANGNTVLPVNIAGDDYQHGDEYPKLGIVVDDSAGAQVVVWRGGQTTSGIAAGATLDQILDPSSPKFRTGDFVRPVDQAANAAGRKNGPVVAVFRRDNDGGGAPGPNRVVVFAESVGLYYEVDEDVLVAQASR